MSKFTDHIKQVIVDDVRRYFSPFVAVFKSLRRAIAQLQAKGPLEFFRSGLRLLRACCSVVAKRIKQSLTGQETKDDQ